jgi:hypothetical protein
MITLLLHLFRLLPFLCGGHRQLALENLALRHQLAVYKRTVRSRLDLGVGTSARSCPGQKLYLLVPSELPLPTPLLIR